MNHVCCLLCCVLYPLLHFSLLQRLWKDFIDPLVYVSLPAYRQQCTVLYMWSYSHVCLSHHPCLSTVWWLLSYLSCADLLFPEPLQRHNQHIIGILDLGAQTHTQCLIMLFTLNNCQRNWKITHAYMDNSTDISFVC